MASIIKVDQIQSDNGMVNVTSNLASVTISNDIVAPLQITTSFNEKVRLISSTDAANEQQAIIGYNAGNYYWQLGAGKDSSNNPFVSIYTGTSGTSLSERLKVTGAGVVELLNGQLKFPSSQNASSDANTLDDYEEGTWTPRVYQNGVEVTSPTSVQGRYVKIGRTIYISGYWYKSGSPNNSSGQWSFRNLPYAVQGGVYDFVSGGYMAINGSPSTQASRFQANGSDLLDLYGQYAGSTWNTSYLEFSFSGVLLALS